MNKFDRWFLFISRNCRLFYTYHFTTDILNDIRNRPMKLDVSSISNLENKLRKDETWNPN